MKRLRSAYVDKIEALLGDAIRFTAPSVVIVEKEKHMSDTAKKRPDLASDALEVAMFGVLGRLFTLSLSATEQKAWLEVIGPEDKVLIDYSIPKLMEVVVAQIREARAASSSSGGSPS